MSYLDKFEDPRFAEAMRRVGGRVMPLPAEMDNPNARKWRPLMDGKKPVRLTSGEWSGELGWGMGDHPCVALIRSDRLLHAELTRGLGKDIPFCEIRFSQFWIFDTLVGDGDEIKRLRQQQKDTLALILKLNGDDAPKAYAANAAALMTAGMAMFDQACAMIGLFSSAPVRSDGRVEGVTEVRVQQVDESGSVVHSETRTEVRREDGPVLEDFKVE